MDFNMINTMFAILRASIGRTCNDDIYSLTLSEEQAKAIYNTLNKHDLAHMIGDVLQQSSIGKEHPMLFAKVQKQQLVAAYRYEQLNYEFQRLCNAFAEAAIPFIPLKGSVIRRYYPESWMRTSCDVDILVHEEDLENAKQAIISKLGYDFQGKGRHDIDFFAPSGVHFELHYSLIENDAVAEADKPLADVWEHAVLSDGKKYQYELKTNMFYYYHIAHMAKHFVQGGCGIRPFLDLWMLANNSEFQLSDHEPLLISGGLEIFAKQAERLSKVWFDGDEHTDTTKMMEEYVLLGGVYGNLENQVAVAQQKKGGKLKYSLSKIWIPYEHLRFHYPSLEGKRALLLFYEVRRWFKLLFRGGVKRSVRNLAVNSNISSEQAENTAYLLSKIGL